MRRLALAVVLMGCAPEIHSGPPDVGPAPDAFRADAATASADASGSMDAFSAMDASAVDGGADANDACIVDYDVGRCMPTASCTARSGYSPTAGHCPGAADIQCCTLTPDVSTNPPIPSGYRLMMQSEVTTPMTDWAVMILHDGATYRLFATTTMTFGTQPVLARVEWHVPDFLNMAVHRGVTLYVPG